MEEDVVAVIPLAFPEVTFPFKLQFLIVLFSALATIDPLVAIRIQEFPITVAIAVLLMVKFRLVPAVFGLSPFIVTLSAPFN